jgi:hypothetical protein
LRRSRNLSELLSLGRLVSPGGSDNEGIRSYYSIFYLHPTTARPEVAARLSVGAHFEIRGTATGGSTRRLLGFRGQTWGFVDGFVRFRGQTGLALSRKRIRDDSGLPPLSARLQRAGGIHKWPSKLLTYIHVCRRSARVSVKPEPIFEQ